jgi:hypothetical protein
MKAEEWLRNLLTPQYSWLFIHMGRLEKGVKFLVDLRTDILVCCSIEMGLFFSNTPFTVVHTFSLHQSVIAYIIIFM